jgi:hypothetical protein
MKNTTLRVAMVLACASLLSACSGRSGAEDAVRKVLKDPDSAKFGEFYFNRKTGKACLTTNAKNAMGGYTGDKEAHLEKTKEGWQYLFDLEETPLSCRKNHADETRTSEQILNDIMKNSSSGSN